MLTGCEYLVTSRALSLSRAAAELAQCFWGTSAFYTLELCPDLLIPQLPLAHGATTIGSTWAF